MIDDDAFPVEPWHVRETSLNLDRIAQTESLFALSNGHIGLRGNLEEGEPHGLPGTYLNGFYETRPLPYAEIGFLVSRGRAVHRRRHQRQDHPTARRRRAVRCALRRIVEHERVLDMRPEPWLALRSGESPAGKQVRVQSTRLVSLGQRSVAAIEYVVEAIDQFVRVTVQSELVANEDQPETFEGSAGRGPAAGSAGGGAPRGHRACGVARAQDPRPVA